MGELLQYLGHFTLTAWNGRRICSWCYSKQKRAMHKIVDQKKYILLHSLVSSAVAGLHGLSLKPALQRSQFFPSVLWAQSHCPWTCWKRVHKEKEPGHYKTSSYLADSVSGQDVNHILCCDWLPEQARFYYMYLVCSGLPALSCKKI